MMMFRTALVCLTCALCGGSFFSAIAAEESVVTLSSDNFDSTIEGNDFVVVEFYAPWCGHCKKLAPEYEKAAVVLKGLEHPIILAKVDATEEKDLGLRFGVKGYPTLKIFRGDVNDATDYTGPRESEGIINYLKKQLGPASQLVSSAEELDAIRGASEVVVIALLPTLESTEESVAAYFSAAGKLQDELTFVHTTEKTLLPEGHSAPAMIMHRKFDVPTVAYEGEFSAASLEEFLVRHSLPQVTELDQNPANSPKLRKLFGSPLPKAMLFADYSMEGVEQIKLAIATAAAEFAGKLVFVQGDANNNQGAMKFFGFGKESLPVVVIHNTDTDLKYSYPLADPAKISDWLKSFLAGEVDSIVKSEEIPESDDGGVKVIVGNNFEKEVMQTDKNVIIEFYAPWCGHCKKLAPIYEKVAEDMKDKTDLVVAKMDATANDVPPPYNKKFLVKGYPTIFFKTIAGEITLYTGGRTEREIVEYIGLKMLVEEEKAQESADSSVDNKVEVDGSS